MGISGSEAVLLWEQDVGGSNPSAPTNSKCGVRGAQCEQKTGGGTHRQFAFRISHIRHRSYFAPRPYDVALDPSSFAADGSVSDGPPVRRTRPLPFGFIARQHDRDSITVQGGAPWRSRTDATH